MDQAELTKRGRHFTRGDAGHVVREHGGEYRKKVTTEAVRIKGPFSVQTREGVLTCPDGYLAIDSHGWPYPIAADEFEAIYERA